MILSEADIVRFWSKVDTSGDCWLWTAGGIPQGYGVFHINRKPIGAHRVAYFIRHGSIREDMPLDHLCRNPPCVNPDHLEQVTQRENVARGTAPSARNMRATHCIRGHPFDSNNTYFRKGRYGIARTCRTCHRERNLRYYHAQRGVS